MQTDAKETRTADEFEAIKLKNTRQGGNQL
jgi:hypothetical protein